MSNITSKSNVSTIKAAKAAVTTADKAGQSARVALAVAVFHAESVVGVARAEVVKAMTGAESARKGRASKAFAAGKALAVAGKVTAADTAAIISSAYDGTGDRAAMMAAAKAGDAAKVVESAKADKPDTGGDKQKASKSTSTTLAKMTTDALIALLGEALDALAVRDDAGLHVDAIVSHGKAATLIGKNLAAMPVA